MAKREDGKTSETGAGTRVRGGCVGGRGLAWFLLVVCGCALRWGASPRKAGQRTDAKVYQSVEKLGRNPIDSRLSISYGRHGGQPLLFQQAGSVVHCIRFAENMLRCRNGDKVWHGLTACGNTGNRHNRLAGATQFQDRLLVVFAFGLVGFEQGGSFGHAGVDSVECHDSGGEQRQTDRL